MFLGSRVSVMTTRPGRIKETSTSTCPRPRDYRVLTEPRFREVVQRVSDAVADEARHAFEVGEREA